MSVSTYGIISTQSKDVWIVKDAIQEVLRNIQDNTKAPLRNSGPASIRAKYEIASFSRGLLTCFTDGDDNRTLWAHFDCDCDHKEIVDGPKIILSLGAWGNSVDIIRKILIYLKHLGPCYLVSGDSTGEYQRIE